MRSSYFLSMSSLNLEERQFIIKFFFENNKYFILVKQNYNAKFEGRHRPSNRVIFK